MTVLRMGIPRWKWAGAANVGSLSSINEAAMRRGTVVQESIRVSAKRYYYFHHGWCDKTRYRIELC